MGTYAAASVEVFVLDKPKVVIPNPIIKSVAGIADLTLSEVTSGSDAGLSFSYWTDAAAKELVTAPKSVSNGNYFIKGTAANGCYDVKQVTVE